MQIGILGAGHIGSALAKHFTQLQHTVAIANSRGPETLGEVARKTGATPVQMTEAPVARRSSSSPSRSRTSRRCQRICSRTYPRTQS